MIERELERKLAEVEESKRKLGRLLYRALAREQALTICLEGLLARQDNARQVLNLMKRAAEAATAEETTITSSLMRGPGIDMPDTS